MTQDAAMNAVPRWPTTTTPNHRIGLIAGWGRYPHCVAAALIDSGYEVHCLAVRGHAAPDLREFCADWREIGVAQLGWGIDFFSAAGVRQAVMAGKIHKVRLFDSWAFWRNLPDFTTLWAFLPHFVLGARDRRDDTLLTTVVDTFAAGGVELLPATDFAPQMLASAGTLAGPGPDESTWRDIRFGWQLARELGRLDIGQAVAVKGQAPLAVEAIEGTDACIRRAGDLCRQGGFVVVKVAKPGQDMRFDVPTVGPGTIATLAEAGASTLAIEADRTILLEPDAVAAAAEAAGITVVAAHEAALFARAAA